MTELVPTMNTIVDLPRDLVEKKKYLRNVYDKVASWVILDHMKICKAKELDSLILTRFTNSIVKSRPIREAGAQQVNISTITIDMC